MRQRQLTREQKKEYAEILFCKEQLDQKVIAKKVGVAEKTISLWANDPKLNWQKKRKRLLITRENQLSMLYDQLDDLNTSISIKEEGKRHANAKEADSILKLTAAIRNMELDLSIADKIKSVMEFVKFIQKVSTSEKAMELTDFGDAFIKSLL